MTSGTWDSNGGPPTDRATYLAELRALRGMTEAHYRAEGERRARAIMAELSRRNTRRALVASVSRRALLTSVPRHVSYGQSITYHRPLLIEAYGQSLFVYGASLPEGAA
jgi:broad specificity phosphatase PhoE